MCLVHFLYETDVTTGRQICEWLVKICIHCMLLPNIGQQIVRVTKHVLLRYIRTIRLMQGKNNDQLFMYLHNFCLSKFR